MLVVGLKRNTVRIVDYQPEWAALAQDACTQIKLAAGNLILAVQQVGSTAAPNFPAKPILDIVAGIVSFNEVSTLTDKYANDRKSYTASKNDFIKSILEAES